jgi:signal transduction histidine kinase
MAGSRFRSDRYLRTFLFVLALCAIIVAFLLLILGEPPVAVAATWRFDALVLLALLGLQSLALFVFKTRAAALLLVFLGLILVVIIGLPFGPWLAFKLALWTALVLEAGFAFERGLAALSQALVLGVLLLFQRRLIVWGVPIDGPNLGSLALSAGVLLALALLLWVLRLFSSVIVSQESQLERLDEAVRELTSANLSFQNLAYTAQERSAEEERKRITREIHDAIGYALTNLIMTMEACLRLAPKDATALRELLSRAREESQTGLNETRKALHVLRRWVPERAKGLAAIQRLVNFFSKATGMAVKVDYYNASLSFGEEKDVVIYRMIQEGLTNAFRHGHASLVNVKFWKEEGSVTVTVWDNGVGGESIKEGIGLQGMRERVELLGGSLSVARKVDGFQLSIRIPLEEGA